MISSGFREHSAPMTTGPESHFSRDTAVTKIGEGRYRASMSRDWWIARGPNGGYVAAVLLRALQAEVGDPVRTPRSLTVHYVRAPEEGEVEILVSVERVGRSINTLSARLVQRGEPMAVALAAFGIVRRGPSFDDFERMDLAPPDFVPDVSGPAMVPLHQRYRRRWAIGSPAMEGTPAPTGDVGGWIRLVDPEPVDYVLVAALTDAWMPSVFSRLGRHVPVPTVDLTIHFRESPPFTDDWSLVRFRCRKALDGYLDEDGEVWSRDGRLLAQSRQLAVTLE